MTFKPLDDLRGQTAVIVGVMGGIGSATAFRLARRGARIIGIVRGDPVAAQTFLDTLPNSQLEHYALKADAVDKEQMDAAVSQIGHCSILVTAIGSTKRIPHERLDLMSDAFFDEINQNNLRSYFTVARAFAPLMRTAHEPVIINIGSIAGQGSQGGSNIAYAASKAGLDSLTRNLAKSLAPVIRVVGVSPGALATKFVPNVAPGYLEHIAKFTPLARVPDVEDVAATVEALCTLIRFTTGNIVNVDGGLKL